MESQRAPSNGKPRLTQSVLLMLASLAIFGCARSQYRQAADSEAYCLIESRQSNPLWQLPDRPVEPNITSRMYVANEADCGPKPPDDMAAHRYMDCPDCKSIEYYRNIPTRNHVENPAWLDYLPRDDDGKIKLTQPLAIDLGLLHSREYQNQFENVYLSALSLSGNRFEFDTQWFGGGGLDYRATGRDLGGAQLLSLSDRLGFGKNLAGGGQFATSVLNSVTWNLNGNTVQSGSAAIITTFTQPLLRGAFRHVRLENLTQAERNLLYDVRDFARFRRQFYVGLTEQYLGLLTQAQAIRNTQTNVRNLANNLEEHKFLLRQGSVTQVDVDQVFQNYQNGRRQLLSSEQNLITSQDQLKFSLGLPSWINFQVDESLLDPFELVDPDLEVLQERVGELYNAVVQVLPPEQARLEDLKQQYESYKELRTQAAKYIPKLEQGFKLWKERLDSLDKSKLGDDDLLDFQQQEKLADQVEEGLKGLKAGLEERANFDREVLTKLLEYQTNPPKKEDAAEQKTIAELLENLDSFEDVELKDVLPDEKDNSAIAAWAAVEDAVGAKLRSEVSEIYVLQTQIRLFSIDIDAREIASETAITYAHRNRLDLMNTKARAMDAFRRVEVAADQLESDLDVSAGIALGSDPNTNSLFNIDSKNNQYNVGLQFDGPLNRRNERNAYRASQILYQQATRNFQAGRDQVANEVRAILRRMELSRLSFQIARQQVVVAIRQVELAQIELRQRKEDANLTLILLQSLDGLLNAKNGLIGNWIEYRVQKMRLFVALEMLYLDEQGMWLNEDTGLEMIEDEIAIDPDYFPPQWVSLDQESNRSDDSLTSALSEQEDELIEDDMPEDGDADGQANAKDGELPADPDPSEIELVQPE